MTNAEFIEQLMSRLGQRRSVRVREDLVRGLEATGWKQVVAVQISAESSGFSHETVNDVTILNMVPFLSP